MACRSECGSDIVAAMQLIAAEAEEDAADVVIYDERKAELAAGHDARLPPEVGAALLRGDSLLKALRNGLTAWPFSTKPPQIG